jgi:hypothetical protein
LGLAPRRGECQTWLVRAVKLGDDGGATRARAAVSFGRSWLDAARRTGAIVIAPGRVAQRESACFTRKRS